MKPVRQVLAQLGSWFRRQSRAARVSFILVPVLAVSAMGLYVAAKKDPVPEAPLSGLARSLLPRDAAATALIPLRTQIRALDVREEGDKFTLAAVFADQSRRSFAPISAFAYKTVQDMLAADIAEGRIALRLRQFEPSDLSAGDVFEGLARGFSVLAIGALLFLMLSQSTLMDGKGRAVELIRPESNTDNFDSLIGLEDVKAEVLQLKALYEDAETYRSYGLDKPFNVLFSGPAGVGKTRLASALARELGLPLLHASGSNLESGYVGGGSRALKSIQRQARRHGRVVVFLDEAQVLLVKRGQQNASNSKWADDTTNTLLSILDGVSRQQDRDIIWIVASNFDDTNLQMDDAVMRRFPLKVNFRLPNRDEREGILKHYLGKRAERVSDKLDVSYVAEVATGLSPALLESLVERAALIAVQEEKLIDDDVLMRAFERIAVGLTDRKTTEHQQRARRVIAVHELGHFFVTLHETAKDCRSLAELKARLPVVKISTEAVSKNGALGFVLMRQMDEPLHTRAELESRLRGLYGGVAAETVFFGEDALTTGAYDDIRKATDLMQKMVIELAMYSTSKVNLAMLGGEAEKGRAIEEIKLHADRLFTDAKAHIEQHREVIDVLADELVARYTFTIEEMLARLDALGALPFCKAQGPVLLAAA